MLRGLAGRPVDCRSPRAPVFLSREFSMYLTVGIDREADGRRPAEIPSLPGVLACGDSRDRAA